MKFDIMIAKHDCMFMAKIRFYLFQKKNLSFSLTLTLIKMKFYSTYSTYVVFQTLYTIIIINLSSFLHYTPLPNVMHSTLSKKKIMYEINYSLLLDLNYSWNKFVKYFNVCFKK